MSESPEPSYYEIALTSRQVLAAFVILLVCLVAAFLSGIWVGRGGAVPAAQETVAEAATGEAAAEDDGLETLSFFGGEEAETGSDAVPAESGPTTLRQDLESAAATPPPARRPPPAASGPADQPAASPPQRAPAPSAAAPARPAAPPAGDGQRQVREPAVAPGGFVVQVFSSRDQEQAQKVVEQMITGGRDAYLSPVEVDGQVMYRVRLGPFEERAEAERMAAEVRRRYRLETWITQ